MYCAQSWVRVTHASAFVLLEWYEQTLPPFIVAISLLYACNCAF